MKPPAPPGCPPGYRLLQPQDVAAGKDVLYISRDPSTPHIHTQILDITINDDKIKLKHKSEAPMKRVFVTDKAAVGAEATGPDRAAIGAVWAPQALPQPHLLKQLLQAKQQPT